MKKKKKKNIFSGGIKLIIAGTAVDFFAWGFIDPFFSTFANGILDNFFLVGLLVALKGLTGLIFLAPLSEVVSKKSPRIAGLIGRIGSVLTLFLYISGGIAHIPALLFLGSFFHGIAGAARDIAARDYLMEESSKKHASTILGTNFSIRYATWMFAAIFAGFIALKIGETWNMSTQSALPYLFLLTIPCFITSFFLVQKLTPNNKPFPKKAFVPKAIYKKEKELFKKFTSLNLQLKFSILLIFFLQIVRSALLLFLPLLALQMELPIEHIGVLIALMHAPMLLSAVFSIFEDKSDRMLFIIGGLLFSSVPLMLLSQVNAPLIIGILAVLTALSVAIIMPANLGNIAANTKQKDASSIAALQIIFQRLGMLFGAFCIGTVSELFGIQSAFILMSLLAISFAGFAIFIRWKFKHEVTKKASLNHPFHLHPLDPHLFHSHHNQI